MFMESLDAPSIRIGLLGLNVPGLSVPGGVRVVCGGGGVVCGGVVCGVVCGGVVL